MKVSYKKLWKLLIDREIKKGELQKAANLCSASMAKLSNNRNVSMDVLLRICDSLRVDVGEVVSFIPDDEE